VRDGNRLPVGDRVRRAQHGHVGRHVLLDRAVRQPNAEIAGADGTAHGQRLRLASRLKVALAATGNCAAKSNTSRVGTEISARAVMPMAVAPAIVVGLFSSPVMLLDRPVGVGLSRKAIDVAVAGAEAQAQTSQSPGWRIAPWRNWWVSAVV